MNQRIDELVSVTSYFDKKGATFYPSEVIWRGRTYKITKIGLHHTYKKGDTLYHIFSVTTDTLFLRLKFNTRNLNWYLEEIVDGF